MEFENPCIVGYLKRLIYDHQVNLRLTFAVKILNFSSITRQFLRTITVCFVLLAFGLTFNPSISSNNQKALGLTSPLSLSLPSSLMPNNNYYLGQQQQPIDRHGSQTIGWSAHWISSSRYDFVVADIREVFTNFVIPTI